MNYVNRAKDIPTGKHWAILRSSAVWIPGDERSRTHPGHGYPERSEPYMTYQVFTTYEGFRIEFEKILNSSGNKEAKGIQVIATYSGKMGVETES